MRQANVGQATESASGSRRTRSNSQAGPVWTVQDLLILVNEIAAVEGDCQNALSSYQKWSIIAENCTALEVVRNVNQCRRKWQCLLADYNLVKEWESNSGCDSYWSLGSERKQTFGLPLDLDKDVYQAIDVFTSVTERADTDSECDPEAEAADIDLLIPEESGLKPRKGRCWTTPRKKRTIKRRHSVLEEKDEKSVPLLKDMERILAAKLKQNRETGPKSKKSKHWSTPQKSSINKKKQLVFAEELEKPVPVVDDMEQILATKVKENTELIHAILAGNDDENVNDELSHLKDEDAIKAERVRCKADKLVVYLADLAKNLKQLCDVVEEC